MRYNAPIQRLSEATAIEQYPRLKREEDCNDKMQNVKMQNVKMQNVKRRMQKCKGHRHRAISALEKRRTPQRPAAEW